MDEKITIIEGPPPVFEPVGDAWAIGLNDSPNLGNIAVTRLRTFNGPALVERCNRAWRSQSPIHLEFRSNEGLINEAPIVAARYVDTDDGHVLLLWLRLINDEVTVEFDYGDDDSADDLPPDDLLP